MAPTGFLVQLSFSSFDLETFGECRYDYLAIYSGIVASENGSQPIGKYCGTASPPIILSSNNALTLIFKSDDSVTGAGFTATYNFIDGRNRKFF